MNWSSIAGIAMLALVAACAADVQSRDASWQQCKTPNPRNLDSNFAACTALIESGGETDANLAVAFNDRGVAYELKGDLGRALADYDQAIHLDGAYAPAFGNRGNIYSKRHDYDRAIAEYDQALRLDPTLAFAFNGRGGAYLLKHDLNRALADLDEAIRLDPHYAFAFHNRGDVYMVMGDYDRALADFDAAIRLKPDYVNAVRLRGAARYITGDFSAAAADFARAAQQSPQLAVWLYLARTRAGDADAGRELAAQAGRLKPSDWRRVAAEMYLGRQGPEPVLGAATTSDEHCEAQFFVGEWHLVRQENGPAIELFEDIRASCDKELGSSMAAAAELKRLGR